MVEGFILQGSITDGKGGGVVVDEAVSSVEDLIRRGVSELRAGRHDSAIRFLEASRRAGGGVGCLLPLGVAWQLLGKPAEALEPLAAAYAAEPQRLETGMNLAATLNALDRWEEAEMLISRALASHPGDVWPHFLRGVVSSSRGDSDLAMQAYRGALMIDPDHGDSLHNLGRLHRDRGEFREAESCFRRAVASNPTHVEAHLALGRLLLLCGREAEGWIEWEWRRRRRGFLTPDTPSWDGSALGGRHLLLVAEQGLGDTLYGLSRALALCAGEARVSLVVQPALIPLLASRWTGSLYSLAEPWPAHDCHLPLLSLGRFVDPPEGEAAWPADPERERRWAKWLGCHPQVAMAWQGNPAFPDDDSRSIPLSHFGALVSCGAALVALQKGPGLEQLASVPFPLRTPPKEFDEAAPFLDTAAILKGCSVLICSDSAIAHLAGNLGIPTWLLLPKIPDWRWGVRGEVCRRYGSLRLFRQRKAGDWSEVFARVQGALRARLQGHRGRTMEGEATV